MSMSPLMDPNWEKYLSKLKNLLPDEEVLLEQEGIEFDYINYCTVYPPSRNLNASGGKTAYLDSKTYSQVQEVKFDKGQVEKYKSKSAMTSIESARKYARFYNAFMLQDILRETPIGNIATTYQISPGMIQNLQLQAANASGILG